MDTQYSKYHIWHSVGRVLAAANKNFMIRICKGKKGEGNFNQAPLRAVLDSGETSVMSKEEGAIPPNHADCCGRPSSARWPLQLAGE